MQNNNCELKILINGKQITEYNHYGKTYVEGRQGSEFEIEFVNHNNYRVEAILSVDGLSIIDGELASENSSGYLVDANSSVKIPGWKLNENNVAKFFFSGKSKSYATQVTGSSSNNGVIGVMVFKEKNKMSDYYNYILGGGNSIMRSLSHHEPGHYDNQSWNMIQCSSSNDFSLMSSGNTQIPVDDTDTKYNLGTGFGNKQQFKTKKVSFERDDMISLQVMYYDDVKGLKARGIDVNKKNTTTVVNTPQAFQSMDNYCKPPKGWK